MKHRSKHKRFHFAGAIPDDVDREEFDREHCLRYKRGFVREIHSDDFPDGPSCGLHTMLVPVGTYVLVIPGPTRGAAARTFVYVPQLLPGAAELN